MAAVIAMLEELRGLAPLTAEDAAARFSAQEWTPGGKPRHGVETSWDKGRDVPVEEAAVADLTEVGGDASLAVRAGESRRLLNRLAAGADERLILDRPVLTLEVAGQTAHVIPQALSHRTGGQFCVVEIRSFPAIDARSAHPTHASGQNELATLQRAGGPQGILRRELVRELRHTSGQQPSVGLPSTVAHFAGERRRVVRQPSDARGE